MNNDRNRAGFYDLLAESRVTGVTGLVSSGGTVWNKQSDRNGEMVISLESLYLEGSGAFNQVPELLSTLLRLRSVRYF